jgi:diacylglycerol kinase (ATP)
MAPPVENSPARPKSALVIANPIAGSGRGERVAKELARELEKAGLRVDVRLTQARGDARRFAADARAEAILSVGGDGTLNEVLHGARDPEVPIGLVPLGTANVLALDLSLSSDPRRAVATVLDVSTPRSSTASCPSSPSAWASTPTR